MLLPNIFPIEDRKANDEDFFVDSQSNQFMVGGKVPKSSHI